MPDEYNPLSAVKWEDWGAEMFYVDTGVYVGKVMEHTPNSYNGDMGWEWLVRLVDKKNNRVVPRLASGYAATSDIAKRCAEAIIALQP